MSLVLAEKCHKCGSDMTLCVADDYRIVWKCPNCGYWFTYEALG